MRTDPIRAARRGFALLIVIGIIALILASTVVAVRAASAAKLSRAIARKAAVATDLERQADALIDAWLLAEASGVVLPPEAEVPAVTVLDDTWEVAGVNHRVRITAWDQCGMVPLPALRRGSTFRGAVDPDALRIIDRAKVSSNIAAGLDLFVATADELDVPSPFPPALAGATTVFGDSADDGEEPVTETPPADDDPPTRFLGSSVATHTPRDGVINVNTARIEFLEDVLRARGRGGIEVIIEARSKGEAPTMTADAPGSRRPPRAVPRPGAGSTVWSFRLDLEVEPFRRSWWLTYRLADEQSGEWHCVQRLPIDA